MSQQEKKKKAIPKPTHFGKNLKFLRRLNGLSQQELANRAGMKRNNIASYEGGLAEPSALAFLRFSEFFNQKPSDMLSNLMIEQTVETTQVIVPALDPFKQQQFEDILNEIVHQTNEMTKIFEGYTSLIELKNIDKENLIGVEFYSSFTDLLDLLKSLIALNWAFIHKTVPSEIQE